MFGLGNNNECKDPVKEYISLVKENLSLKDEVATLSQSYSIQKSLTETSFKEDIEIRKKIFDHFNAFMSQYKKDVSSLLRKSLRVEKRKNMIADKYLPTNVRNSIDTYYNNKDLYKKGKLDLCGFDAAILKSLETPVRYADMLVFNESGRFLILHRYGKNSETEHGEWCLPGGHVDMGETFNEAAVRELFEETSIRVDVDSAIKCGSYKSNTADIEYYCVQNVKDDLVVLNSEEHDSFKWILPDEIKDYDFIFDLGSFLKKYFYMDCQVVSLNKEDLAKAFMKGKISKKMFKELMDRSKEISVEKADVTDAGTLAPESLDGEKKNCIEKSHDRFVLKFEFSDLEQADMLKSIVEDLLGEGKISAVEEISTDIINHVEANAIAYMNFLEGMKTCIKGFHWAEKDESKHEYLDEFATSIAEFEDKIAEAIQANVGRFDREKITGEQISVNNEMELVDLLYERTSDFRAILEAEGANYKGEVSWLDDFLGNIKQNKYRLQMD